MVLGPLPPELLLEVISHLPQTYSSYEAHALAAPRLVFAREDALRALCTTSHRLRTCCFPTLWERFYAEPLASQGSAIMLTSHGLNTPLRRLRRLLVAPHIWPHIRSLSVAFLRNDATDDGTITALVQVLRRLPMLLSLTFSAACDQQIPPPHLGIPTEKVSQCAAAGDSASRPPRPVPRVSERREAADSVGTREVCAVFGERGG
ncbi:hypothetical protein C8F01DRAFT_337545 [Mycena amicta]|nr:hypothetical protein C8F01DRAFT_337545 [Mycena amicta]